MVCCGNCGAPALPDSAFCRGCGTALSTTPPALDPLATFVGPNYATYQRKWEACDRRSSTYSWNWPAFLFGLFWMAYRKMYVNAGILLGIACLESVATYLFHLADAVANAMNLALAVVIGLQGNHWYRKHVTKRIADITPKVPVDRLQATLAAAGGTNAGAAIIAFVLLVAVIAALYSAGGPPTGETIST